MANRDFTAKFIFIVFTPCSAACFDQFFIIEIASMIQKL
jgi:hypothetical protein